MEHSKLITTQDLYGMMTSAMAQLREQANRINKLEEDNSKLKLALAELYMRL